MSAEIGWEADEPDPARVGLDFPRTLPEAIHAATRWWNLVDRRHFLTLTGLAVTGWDTPLRRWLTTPLDPTAAHPGDSPHPRRVGAADITELLTAAEDARRWDSRYGGGNWRSSALVVCLRDRVAPLLHGRYTDAVGRRLFTAAAHLSRLAGWTAFDRGHHAAAQRHYVQALRLARAAGDVAFGGYTLACAALQATLRGWHDHAIDMCQGAYERAKHQAPARVLAFTALIEARAHARAGDRRAAAHALSTSERLLGQAERQQGVEPDWIDFYSPARMAADAVEIHRDLHLPAAARRWNEQAAMPTDQFARSYGLRLTVLATTHLQGPSPDVDLALEYGRHALDVLSTISSARANDYTHDLARRLVPWKDHGPARDLIHRIRTDVPFT